MHEPGNTDVIRFVDAAGIAKATAMRWQAVGKLDADALEAGHGATSGEQVANGDFWIRGHSLSMP